MGIGLNTAKPNKRDRLPRIEDIVKVKALDRKKFTALRLMPGDDWLVVAVHWITITTKAGKEIRIPKNCIGFDPVTDGFDNECPYCDLGGDNGTARKAYYANVLFRKMQDDEPDRLGKPTKTEAKTGFKDDTESDAWTPVQVLRLPPSLVGSIQGLSELNKHRVDGKRVQFSVNDGEYGTDVNIKFDPDAEPSRMYDVQIGQPSPLTEDEEAYLLWDLSNPDLFPQESFEEATEELGRMSLTDVEEEDEEEEKPTRGKQRKSKAAQDDEELDIDDDDDDEEEDEPPPRKKKTAKKKRKPEPEPEEDDDDEDEDDLDLDEEDEEFEEEEPPPRKKKTAKKKKPEPEPEDDDDEDDLDLDEEDEEEEPPPRKKKRPAKKKPAPEPDDDDDDLDLDEDDEEEEEAPPPRKKKKKKPAPEPEEDDDDDLDLDDEEEEEEPPPRKKKVAKKKRPAPEPEEDDDDDDDLELEDDDDEEEAPPPRKKKRRRQ